MRYLILLVPAGIGSTSWYFGTSLLNYELTFPWILSIILTTLGGILCSGAAMAYIPNINADSWTTILTILVSGFCIIGAGITSPNISGTIPYFNTSLTLWCYLLLWVAGFEIAAFCKAIKMCRRI